MPQFAAPQFAAQRLKAHRLSQARMGHAIVMSWIFILTASITWPLFAGPSQGISQLLLRDMVIAPHPPLTDAARGLTTSAARAVPQDLALWAVGSFIDASTAVKAVLVLSFLLGGLAAAELARVAVGARLMGQIAAPTMLLWNPYVAERLLQGHWSLVIAAMMLPAIALASIRGAAWWRASAMGLAALTPTGAVLGGVVACVSAGTWRDRTVAFFTTLAVSSPWLTATALTGSGVTSDASGAAAFAARAENFVGTFGAVAALGGMWNGAAVPVARNAGIAPVMVIVLLAFFAVGAKTVWRAQPRLVVMAAAAVAVISALATSAGIAAMELALHNIAGAGLFRDTHKWVALALPSYVLCAAAAADAIAARLPYQRQWLAGSVAVLVIFAAVPQLPRDVEPLRPVAMWPGWSPVAGVVAMDTSSVAVLPTGAYRIIEGRPVYDPATKILPAPIETSGTLVVSGRSVAGEGSRDVEHALLTAQSDALDILRQHGVGWVLVENSPGQFGQSHVVTNTLDEVYVDDHLALYRVPGAITLPQPAPIAHRVAMWVAFTTWLVVLASGFIRAAIPRDGVGRRHEAVGQS